MVDGPSRERPLIQPVVVERGQVVPTPDVTAPLSEVMPVDDFTASDATQPHLSPINAYARQLLAPDGALQREVDERLRLLGEDPQRAVALSDAYQLSFPPDAFNERSHAEQLKDTATQVARFIADAHVANRGARTSAFRTVEVLPYAVTDDTMKLEAAEGKLLLGLQRDWRSLLLSYRVPNTAELKAEWASGAQFDSTPRGCRVHHRLHRRSGRLSVDAANGRFSACARVCGARPSPRRLAFARSCLEALMVLSTTGLAGRKEEAQHS